MLTKYLKCTSQVFCTVQGIVKKHYYSSHFNKGSLFTHNSEWIELPFSISFQKYRNIFEKTPRNQKEPVFYESEGANKKTAVMLVRVKGGDPFDNVDR